jgi:hypothetical protein
MQAPTSSNPNAGSGLKRHLPRVAAGVCALVLAGGAGLAVSQARSGAALPAGNASGQGGPGVGGPGRPGAGGFMDVSALAKELGVSTAKLEAALKAARPDGDPGAGDPGGDGDMAAALAEALGLSEARVSAALEAVRPERPDGAAPGIGGGTPPDASGGGTAPDDAAPDGGTTATPDGGATT